MCVWTDAAVERHVLVDVELASDFRDAVGARTVRSLAVTVAVRDPLGWAGGDGKGD
jgi:hypothetical protein